MAPFCRERRKMKNKSYTKQSIKAILTLMTNLCEEAWNFADELCTVLAPNSDDDIYGLMTEIQERSRTDVDEIMNDLEKGGYFNEANISDGPELNPVNIKVDNWHTIELDCPLKEGSLVSYVSSGDPEAISSGILYRTKDNVLKDLAYVEQKNGYLAECSGLDRDNEDLDIYLYEDPSREDFTYKCHVFIDDIIHAING